MKQIICLAVLLFFSVVSYAQKDSDFYKHELGVSVGDTKIPPVEKVNYNISVSYFYRPVKWFWVGGNFINYFGDKIYYYLREYDMNGSFNDFSKSKTKNCAVIAPEIRFSCLNTKSVILYNALSGGIGWENGFDSKRNEYPKQIPYIQLDRKSVV